MCLQNSRVHHSGEEEIEAEDSLLIYCKPVEFYNILYHRSLHNPSFLQRCLSFKICARRERRLRSGVVIFNYRDCYNILRKSEVTEEFSCPFCLMRCASFKGLQFHLCSSHDLFNFEFWVTEDLQAVNVAVKVDISRKENVADGVNPQSQTFFFCSRPRKRLQKDSVQNRNRAGVKFLKLDSPTEGIKNGFLENDILSCKGENMSRISPSQKDFQNGRHQQPNLFPLGVVGQNGSHGGEKFSTNHPGSMDFLEHVASSFNIPGVPLATPQSSVDPECSKSVYRSDPAVPAKTKKFNMDRSDSRNRMLLQKRQFFHSHRVQPMTLEEVLSDCDSEDDIDHDIADIEDQRMLDDFVDVSKEEKQLMHLWNSFVRKQRVLADTHIPWAFEAFSKLHVEKLISSGDLFWSWRLFMVKLWKTGLLDARTMDKCSILVDKCRNQGLELAKVKDHKEIATS
ncbi:hypothetical protein TanjilG_05464 [Lupinus angustifolius]|uniref:Uncharacterized protein n=1 Tax=Lupinus angustifolius TaxID=3871 RepID=A0A4P1QSS4_LUPAN|nr:PREDICTED: polycomb group protein EMBRYONIC FLOWER 2-like [Lupinus angustifolius]OIV94084.1 hypothetical protein TanjilG_05464 [Lupinus angustifolius]